MASSASTPSTSSTAPPAIRVCSDCKKTFPVSHGAVDGYVQQWFCGTCLDLLPGPGGAGGGDRDRIAAGSTIMPEKCSAGYLASLLNQIAIGHRVYYKVELFGDGAGYLVPKSHRSNRLVRKCRKDFYQQLEAEFAFEMREGRTRMPFRIDKEMMAAEENEESSDHEIQRGNASTGSGGTGATIPPAGGGTSSSSGGNFPSRSKIHRGSANKSRSRSRSRSRDRPRGRKDGSRSSRSSSGSRHDGDDRDRDGDSSSPSIGKKIAAKLDRIRVARDRDRFTQEARAVEEQQEFSGAGGQPASADGSNANMHLTCHRCGQRGHLVRNCPQQMTCHRCGEPGHYARDCPNISHYVPGQGNVLSTFVRGDPRAVQMFPPQTLAFAPPTTSGGGGGGASNVCPPAPAAGGGDRDRDRERDAAGVQPAAIKKVTMDDLDDFRTARSKQHYAWMKVRDAEKGLHGDKRICNLCGQPGHIARECSARWGANR
eukprot:g8822.t1